MCSGCFRTVARAMDKRSMVPLPLFLLPSISSMLEPLSSRFIWVLFLCTNDVAGIKINEELYKITMWGCLCE